MISAGLALHRGGTVLWESSPSATPSAAVDRLMSQVVITGRQDRYLRADDDSRLHWRPVGEFDVIMVLVCSSLVSESIAEQAIGVIVSQFLDSHKDSLRTFTSTYDTSPYASFTSYFKSAVEKYEDPDAQLMAALNQTLGQSSAAAPGDDDDDGGDDSDADPKDSAECKLPSCESPTGKSGGHLAKLLASGPAKRGGRGGRGAAKKPDASGSIIRDDFRRKLLSEEDTAAVAGTDSRAAEMRRAVLRKELEAVQGSKTDLNDWESVAGARGIFGNASAKLTSVLRSIPVGTRAISDEDLSKVANVFRTLLLSKNVALKPADDIVGAAVKALRGSSVKSFETLEGSFRKAVTETLASILAGSRSIDLLGDIAAHAHRRAKGARPYVLLFCGVNGVGKTTSLVKVASWLRAAGLTVLLAACDTYRTGAIEQLRTHSEVLGVPLFESGYNQSDTIVARNAIAKGCADGVDVVLVDSAGRMQHAEALMRSLRALVKEAAPDTVMFVGEAGAGNDIADQVAAFSGRSVLLHAVLRAVAAVVVVSLVRSPPNLYSVIRPPARIIPPP